MAAAFSRAAGYCTEKSELIIPGGIHTCPAAHVSDNAAGWGGSRGNWS